jgi:hypothetical protein
MSANANKVTTIYAPRSFPVFMLQLMSLSPVATAAIIVATVFFEETPASLDDILLLLLSVVILFALAFIMFYFPGRRITRLVFDREASRLIKAKRGYEPKLFDLHGVQQILSKRTFSYPAWKYSMVIQDRQGRWQSIFDEDTPFGGKHWAVFSERLSEITGIQIKQELWTADMNGKLSLTTNEKVAYNRKRNLVPLVVAAACTFLGAVVFRMHPTPGFLLYAGLASVAASTAISLVNAVSKKHKMGDLGPDYFTLTVSILTVVIPYALFYLSFAFLLNGFRLPMVND